VRAPRLEGERDEALAANARQRAEFHAIAALPALYDLAERVAEHFDGTDAPLGVLARAALAQARGES
jgi:hypothetical protein